MAIKLIEKTGCFEAGVCRCEFVMDSAADAANLPKCGPGSTAIVAAKGGGIYMVNASGEWEEL